MSHRSVEFLTNEELITELRNRSSFLGVVLFKKDGMREKRWDSNKAEFKLYISRNMNKLQAGQLMLGSADKLLKSLEQ